MSFTEQFTIPQFIDVEDKIFGPITARQFIILISSAGPIFLCYKIFDIALFALMTFFIGGSALIFAFVKINGQAFHYFVLNIAQTVRKPSRRLWYKSYTNESLRNYIKEDIAELKRLKEGNVEKVERRAPSNTRIRDLSLLVNTGGYFNA
jgi:hypothetical protein